MIDWTWTWYERKKRGKTWFELWTRSEHIGTVYERGGAWLYKQTGGGAMDVYDPRVAKRLLEERLGIPAGQAREVRI